MTTGLLYDPLFLEHDTGAHPESPARLTTIMKAVDASGLRDRLSFLPFGPATVDALHLVHHPSYVRRVAELARRGGGYLDADTVVSARTYDAAALAAGAVIASVDHVLAGRAGNAFAAVRPPGHHARPNCGMGFCIFNNVAIAARHAQRNNSLSRILIVDLDVHHGNGTQEVFAADPSVLYFSTHLYPFYPGTGHVDEIGEGAGRGFTVNVPLPSGVGDAAFKAVFAAVLEPLAVRHRPELILVSAGYDTHWLDPIGMMRLSIAGLAAVIAGLRSLASKLCGGRLVLALEGGYALQTLGPAVVATLNVLMGRPPTDPFGPATKATEPDIRPLIERLKAIHQL